MEYDTSLGEVREVAEAGGSVPDHLIKILPHGGPGGGTLWVVNLGIGGSDAAKTQGGTHGFPDAGDGYEGSDSPTTL